MKFVIHIFLVMFIQNSLMAADATIDIIKTIKNSPSIAIEYSGENSLISQKLYSIIISDLKLLAYFKVQDKREYNSEEEAVLPQNMQKNYVLKYSVQEENGALIATFSFLNTASKRILFGKTLKVSSQEEYVFLSHEAIYDINKYLNAPNIEWMRKFVVYVEYTAPKKTNIVVSDYSLNYKQVVVKNAFNVFVKWANKEQTQIYYTNLDDRPTIYKLNIFTGEKKKILSSDGIAIVSDVSNLNANKLLVSISNHGQPDVYVYDTNFKTKQRLTKYGGIDVNAKFVDKDRAIVFVSNRLGYPNVFRKTLAQNAPIEQMVFYNRSNSAISTFGDYVAYSSRESSSDFRRGTFNIHLISTKTNYIRRLTANGINQFPNFSPDGNSILFIKNYLKESAIGIIRLNYNKTFLFPAAKRKIQSLDW